MAGEIDTDLIERAVNTIEQARAALKNAECILSDRHIIDILGILGYGQRQRETIEAWKRVRAALAVIEGRS